MNTQNTAHAITITPSPRHLRISFNGHVIVDTEHALMLREGAMNPVYYVPRGDADVSALTATSRKSHCPFKGEASYFSISAGGKTAENAIWSYEQPLPGVAAIAGHLAFYTDRVTIEEL